MTNSADEISQREKRRILIEERRMRTYMGQALDADLDLGGRFAKVHTTTVTGSSPISYPAQPAHSLPGIMIHVRLNLHLDIQWRRWSLLANHMSELLPQRHRLRHELKLAMMLGVFAVEA